MYRGWQIAAPLKANTPASQSRRFVAVEVGSYPLKERHSKGSASRKGCSERVYLPRQGNRRVRERRQRRSGEPKRQTWLVRRNVLLLTKRLETAGSGILAFLRKRPSWKSSQQRTASAPNRSFSEDDMFSIFSLTPVRPQQCKSSARSERPRQAEMLKGLRASEIRVENVSYLFAQRIHGHKTTSRS